MNNSILIDAILRLASVAQDFPDLMPAILEQISNMLSSPLTEGRKCSTVEELRMAMYQGKIEAIKAYRIRTGRGLKESKDQIENDMHELGLLFYTRVD
jgi:hypothetical protein